MRLARTLADRMPVTAKAWHAGQLGMGQAEVIAAAIDKLDDDLSADIESALAQAAGELSVGDLANLAELIRSQAAPEEQASKHRSEYDKQSLTMVKTMGGSWDLKGRFDAETGVIIRQVLDAFTSRAAKTVDAEGLPVDPPPATWRRAQALLAICRAAAGHHDHCDPAAGYGRPTIIATIALEQLHRARLRGR